MQDRLSPPVEKRRKARKKKSRSTRGDGSVYQRKSDGKYVAVASLGQSADGRQVRKTFYGDSAKAARDKRREWLRSGEDHVERARAKKTSVIAVGEMWLDTLEGLGRKRSTIANYKSLFSTHVKTAAVGALLVSKVTKEHIERFHKRMEHDGDSTRLRQAVHIILSALFRYAVEQKMIPRSPMIGVKRPGGSRQAKVKSADRVRIWTEEEVRTFLDFARGKYGKTYGALFEVLLGTGLRPGEAYALRWRDIDVKRKTITVRETLVDVDGEQSFEVPKTEESRRTISIGDSVIAALGEPGPRGELVFVNSEGTPHDRNNVRRALESLSKRAKVPVRTPHELRHTHASLLLARGHSIRMISTRLGHKDITTTLQYYSHLMPNADEGAAKEFDAILGGGGEDE